MKEIAKPPAAPVERALTANEKATVEALRSAGYSQADKVGELLAKEKLPAKVEPAPRPDLHLPTPQHLYAIRNPIKTLAEIVKVYKPEAQWRTGSAGHRTTIGVVANGPDGPPAWVVIVKSHDLRKEKRAYHFQQQMRRAALRAVENVGQGAAKVDERDGWVFVTKNLTGREVLFCQIFINQLL